MSAVQVTSTPMWAQACSNAFVPLRVRSAASDFRASLEQITLAPGVTLTRVASSASQVYRSRHVIIEHPRDDVIVSLHRSGAGTVDQNGRTARLRAGSAVLYDASTPYTLSFSSRISEIVLQVPRRSIRHVGNAFEALTARTLPDSAALSALISLAGSSSVSGIAHRPLEGAAVADALTGLLSVVLCAGASSSEEALAPEFFLASLRSYADEHLTDPALTANSLARAHHVSLRQVQKIFAGAGDSPAAYIRRGRLNHARRVLLAGASVGTACRNSGFSDPDTFTRAFKREFGCAPSDLEAT